MNRSSILGLLSLAILTLSSSCTDQASKKSQRGDAKSYNLMTIKEGSSSVSTQYSAIIRGVQNVEIRPKVTGLITEIKINEGADVSLGETLFIINQEPYIAALNMAVANVKRAESAVATAQINATSAEELLSVEVISDNEYQIALNNLLTAKADLALAKAQEQSARSDLSDTVITSPVDGVASMIPYRIGSLVNSSITNPLVSVTNNDHMHVYFSLSEPQLLSMIEIFGSIDKMIDEMAHIELIMSNGAKYNKPGKIDAISGTIDRTTGTVSLRATFDNPDYTLRDGGSGRVVITIDRDNVIEIPKVATFELQDKVFAYKVVDGKASSVQVDVFPINNGNDFIVESGLKVGDVIIAEGAGLVREGAKVIVD